jgi:double-strand break repair protein MRE11
MAFFEIKEKKFRMKAIKYQQVRQFLYRDISLKDYPHLDPKHSKIEEQIKDVLVTKINSMILEGREEVNQQLQQQQLLLQNGHSEAALQPRIKFTLREPHKVLLRLRVEHEGFPSLNQQRFGAQFVGEVANPADVLLFAKKRAPAANRATEGALSSRQHAAVTKDDLKKIISEGAEDEINKIKIEDLVNETLTNSNHTLSLLAESEMAQVCYIFFVHVVSSGLVFFQYFNSPFKIEPAGVG